jgi:hypothetical protein
LLPYLADEPNAMWSRYTIQPPAQEQAVPLINAAPIPTSSDFDSDAYNKLVDGHPFKFISPKFTSNDKNFRLDGKKLDDQTISNLESDRFRMVAYYDTGAGQLIVATDEATLSSYTARSTGGDSRQAPKEQDQQIKLSFDANPHLIYTETLNNPALSAGERKNQNDQYSEIAKYRRLNFSFEPLPEDNGLLLRWGADRD